MNFSETFIRKPIATCLLTLAIAMFGVLAYRARPVSELPQLYTPTIQVSAQLPGKSPQAMAFSVTAVLERQFTTPGRTLTCFLALHWQLSTSYNGLSEEELYLSGIQYAT